MMNPKARERDLLVKELANETVIYDQKRDKAHCLNRSAALIWRHCDGQTSVGQMVTLLRKQDLPADEAVVWLALGQLARAHLLDGPSSPRSLPTGVSRRQVVRRLAQVGGLSLLLPVITSVGAPPAAASGSAISGGGDCGAGKVCCQLTSSTDELTCKCVTPNSGNCVAPTGGSAQESGTACLRGVCT